MNIRMRLCVTTLAATTALTAAFDSTQAHSISGPITRPSAGVGAESGTGAAASTGTPSAGQFGTQPPTAPPTARATSHSVLPECKRRPA
jgi:hypothetical protein